MDLLPRTNHAVKLETHDVPIQDRDLLALRTWPSPTVVQSVAVPCQYLIQRSQPSVALGFARSGCRDVGNRKTGRDSPFSAIGRH